MKQLRLEDFTDKVGATFRLRTDDGEAIDVELIEAAKTGKQVLERQPFSIVFRIPDGVVEHQRIYRVEHDELGEIDLFLVPIGPGKEGMQCEAVFT